MTCIAVILHLQPVQFHVTTQSIFLTYFIEHFATMQIPLSLSLSAM